jgi:hypothetical protein
MDGRGVVVVGGVRGCGAECMEDPDVWWVIPGQVFDGGLGVGVDEWGWSARLDAATDLESQRQCGREVVAGGAVPVGSTASPPLLVWTGTGGPK